VTFAWSSSQRSKIRGVARDWGELSFDAGLLGASNIVAGGLGCLQAVLLARWLGPEQYGVVSLIIAYPNLWWGLLDAKAKEAAVRYVGEFHARGDAVQALAICKVSYGIDAACSLAACGFVLATLPWAGRFVPLQEAPWLMALYACGSIPFALVGTSRAALGVLGRFDVLAATDVGLSVLRTGLVLIWAFLGGGVSGVVLATTVGIVVTGVAYGAIGHMAILDAWGGFWLRSHVGAVRDHWREIARFITHNSTYIAINTIASHGDVLVLGAFRSAGEVGAFKLAKTVAGIIDYVRGPIQTVTYAALARRWGTGERDAFRAKIASLSTRVGVPLGLVGGVIAILGPLVIPFLVSNAYDGAVAVARILLLSAAVQAAFFWVRVGYMAVGRLQALIIGSAVGSSVLGLAWLAVVRDFGSPGIAWATTVLATLQNAGLAYVLFRILREVPGEARPTSMSVQVPAREPFRDA
jgi:O-antigen/teichoic acid export membrane protein